ncbi:hypothetical protein ES288_D03G157800v1 [Gossypium darwinii]|uniref:DC1 domain-containing protein n=1 Tax=Gossypium darwinii TaxID=34276 RepID=A0A5D2D4Y3_GOSDA|nr:hypothetical protein ES288_D03G157800v1 [Gossypium darwinii]
MCDFFQRSSSGFVYHCDSCNFDLHINCALLQSSIAPNFPTSLHQHPLFFIQDHNNEVNRDCSRCLKPLSSPIYYCFDCNGWFHLHKQYAEVPLEINHPYDRRKHPLTLLPKRPTYLPNCSCYLCKIQWEGFVYSYFLCKIELTLDDFFSPQTITNANHEYAWMILSRQRICYEEVDTRYGSYHCNAFDCDYIVHMHCATDKAVWDGKSILKDYDERSMEALDESINWITDVVEKMNFGEITIAHLLTLTNSNAVIFVCSAYQSLHHGFNYKCNDRNCMSFCECDIRCILLSDTLEHPCHDRHPLTLTCFDDFDSSQHYCDLCEYERDPNDWFYCCAECNNSLHSRYALGDLPFLKIGSNLDKCLFLKHPHPFTIMKNIWDCPPCKFCGEVCNGQALQCKESECNFSAHWNCTYHLHRSSNSNESSF